MRIVTCFIALICGLMAGGGCLSINVPSEVSASLLPPDTSFIIKGQAQAAEPGQFPVWLAEDNQGFALFQTTNISNDDFDALTTAGSTGRIQVSVRNDLVPLCRPDVIPVEVLKVLEINGVDKK